MRRRPVTAIAFSVHGTPAPQGSKTKWGTEDNPRTGPWRAAIAAEASAAMNGLLAIHEPVTVNVLFYFPRPKSHYRSGKHAGEMKPGAPNHCATKPDLDKLLRAIGDAITGIVIRDDCQIVAVAAVKHYGPPHAEITISPLPEEEH